MQQTTTTHQKAKVITNETLATSASNVVVEGISSSAAAQIPSSVASHAAPQAACSDSLTDVAAAISSKLSGMSVHNVQASAEGVRNVTCIVKPSAVTECSDVIDGPVSSAVQTIPVDAIENSKADHPNDDTCMSVTTSMSSTLNQCSSSKPDHCVYTRQLSSDSKHSIAVPDSSMVLGSIVSANNFDNSNPVCNQTQDAHQPQQSATNTAVQVDAQEDPPTSEYNTYHGVGHHVIADMKPVTIQRCTSWSPSVDKKEKHISTAEAQERRRTTDSFPSNILETMEVDGHSLAKSNAVLSEELANIFGRRSSICTHQVPDGYLCDICGSLAASRAESPNGEASNSPEYPNDIMSSSGTTETLAHILSENQAPTHLQSCSHLIHPQATYSHVVKCTCNIPHHTRPMSFSDQSQNISKIVYMLKLASQSGAPHTLPIEQILGQVV